MFQPNFEGIGKLVLIAGIGLMVVGGIIILLSRIGIKNIPGTIRFEAQGITCIIPLLGSIVLSILLTVLLNVLLRIFRH